ncbi:hypothetical protein K438DRAFT_1938654 [Mycena galopus ATCC 62051]|nr:hypothetical protein K438DRAFT_1938654 [Mycena galopus ATCC 62051]
MCCFPAKYNFPCLAPSLFSILPRATRVITVGVLYLSTFICSPMACSDEKGANGSVDPPTSDLSQSFPMPAHIHTFSSTSQTARLRSQVKIACTKCQKACKKCDQARPCLRCVKYRFRPEECVDSQRKERRKGTKRGPYKKRDEKGNIIGQSHILSQIERDTLPAPSDPPPPATSAGSIPVEYNVEFHAQFPLALEDRPTDSDYPQFYRPPPVPASPNIGEGSAVYSSHYGFFMTAYAQSHPRHVAYARRFSISVPVGGDEDDYEST